ncbi:MAG: hypothetical protein ACLU9S_08325 [Oscillospiraceae bacterium]
MIERTTVMVDDFSIEPHHLPKNIFSVVSYDQTLTPFPASLDGALEELERQMILNSYQKQPLQPRRGSDRFVYQSDPCG